MSFFPITDGWRPNKANYPFLYLVDISWNRWDDEPALVFEPFSMPSEVLSASKRPDKQNDHSEKTRAVLRDIVPDFPIRQMTLIGTTRINDKADGTVIPPGNIPEAIESIRFANPPVGSVVMVNVAFNNVNSVLTDRYIGQQLVKLTTAGCVVIVSAGNTKKHFPNELTPPDNQVIICGGYGASAYGDGVTCYMPTPITISSGIEYSDSSAAAAQLTGVVLLMQNYAKTKGDFLTSGVVKSILASSGNPISMVMPTGTINGFTPTWSALKKSINNQFVKAPRKTGLILE